VKPLRLDPWLDYQTHWIFDIPPTSNADCRNKDYLSVFEAMVRLISKYDNVFDNVFDK